MGSEAPSARRDDRKLELVERILRGQLTLQEACVKHGVSGAELKEWMRLYRREARRVLDDRVRAALSTEGMELEDLESAEFSGNVESLAVAEVIQTLALGRKDAEVVVEHDGEQSRIWCAEGDVVDAECGRLIGAPAVYRLLTLQRGRVHADCSVRFAELHRARTITVSTQALLMESARRSDECRELCARIGDMKSVYVTSSMAMSPDAHASPSEFVVLRLFDAHRSLERIVQDSSLPDLETLTHILQLRERGMLDPRVTPPPPLPLPPGSQRSPRSQRGAHEESAELSFVPLAASLGTRYEPRLARRWVWGLVGIGAATLGLALALRYADQQRRSAQRAARVPGASMGAATTPGAVVPAAALVPVLGNAAGALVAPSGLAPPVLAPSVVVPPALVIPTALAAPATAACPEGAARLARPATRDTEAESYCLDRYEVTAAAYAQCVNAEGCSAARRELALPEVALSAGARRRAQSAFGAQCISGAPGRGPHPMNCVTYEQAESYCRWRGGKLPSDAEWEFAAQGVNGRPYPWGSAKPGPGLVNACGSECKSWYGSAGLQPVFEGVMYEGSDGYAGTAPVGSFPAGGTPEGIQDLIGNVAEWTSGRVEVYDGSAGGDAVASHVVRGGAFTSSQAALAPPVLRLYLSAEDRDRSVGFRCAYSP
jgi:formylglycine-generating enzyme required for sulfatase activity/transposase-like protein